MPVIGQSQRFIGKVSATLELTCFDYECSSLTELLQIQPTWTGPMKMFPAPGHASPWKTGCAWHYDSASKISSTNVSHHIQHLLSLFLPIKSRLEEMRPSPHIKISLCWECTAVGVQGMTGPEFSTKDLKGIAELEARLVVKVIEKNEIAGG